ncbi:hypothetical protein [Streptomyces sp. NBC_00385]|uniref:hypothetical protein n=1 Tax=Streptomyces sp. NBC_00385 TaxID=2975733 RepID=UPI002DD964FE|nr:hypothetical protein [Streptomyces sp. NBC_00385]WRZ09281.1 hypothetical protein OG959_26710 [Streptomyces sp. NBC_00385]
MRSPARLVTGTAAAALAAAALGLSAAAPSAYGDELGPLEITPASAAPGSTVTVNTTACGGDTGATGDASALDVSEFALAPATLKEVLAGSFQVPGTIEPGPYSIDVACENGKRATGEIEVKAAGTTGTTGKESAAVSSDEDSPAGAGLPSDLYDSEEYDTTGLDEAEASGSALVPDAPALPGRGTPTPRPTPSGHESSGGHEPPSGHRTSAAPTAPTGHVKTGVGGSVGPDTTQIAAGAGVLAATAVGGAWLLRRRASGTQDGS